MMQGGDLGRDYTGKRSEMFDVLQQVENLEIHYEKRSEERVRGVFVPCPSLLMPPSSFHVLASSLPLYSTYNKLQQAQLSFGFIMSQISLHNARNNRQDRSVPISPIFGWNGLTR